MLRDDDKADQVWCWDSETGHKYLLDVKTGQVLETEECKSCQQKT